jgi:hypothetical protein
MSNDPIKTHGVSLRNVASDDLDQYVEQLRIDGYAVVPSGISEENLSHLSAQLDRLLEVQQAEMSGSLGEDADIVRCPLAYDESFIQVATNPALMSLCRRLFGENFVLLQQNGIINRPHSSEYQTRWHRDLSYQHFVVSRKIALNALLCLDDFSVETGGTYVLPATHLIENFPTDEYVATHERVAMAPAGSLLVLDAMLFHRSGGNRSTANRRGVNHVIGLPFFAQQIDIPRLLSRDMSSDPFLNRYLGYRWNPASDVKTWRMRRR